jgi:hypothetical protein
MRALAAWTRPHTLTLTLGGAVAAAGCARPPACDGLTCAAACPRDSVLDSSGRCACADGDVPLLGACVPPPVGEAFCGRAATLAASAPNSEGGCAYRACAAGQSLDVVTGACLPRASLPTAAACAAPAVAIVEAGRLGCASAVAACPRGTTPSAASAGAGWAGRSPMCDRPLACPPGSLADGAACRPVVTAGGRGGSRVDVGAWAALALGIDGGPGSAALCQPLAQRPGAFGSLPLASERAADGGAADGGVVLAAAADRRVRVAIAIRLPDQDVSRLHAEVLPRDASGRPLSAVAEAIVSGSVGTLLEALRGLGGEASAASVELEVTCAP